MKIKILVWGLFNEQNFVTAPVFLKPEFKQHFFVHISDHYFESIGNSVMKFALNILTKLINPKIVMLDLIFPYSALVD